MRRRLDALDVLTREDAERIVRALQRLGGRARVRDLVRSHGLSRVRITAAADAGVIVLEVERPHTGRPSTWARVPENVNVYQSAELARLPRRNELPLGLSEREKRFVRQWACRRGVRFFRCGRHHYGSGVNAYMVAGTDASEASIRTLGPRMARKPSIRAGRILMLRTRGAKFPPDLHSRGKGWLELVHVLDRAFRCEWPLDILVAVVTSRTLDAALDALEATPSVRALTNTHPAGG